MRPDAGPAEYCVERRLEGMAAYRAGQPTSACPYPTDSTRKLDLWCWIDGWVQARGPRTPPVDELTNPPEVNPWGAAWGDTPVG